jgi:hypothetical protein
VGLFPYGVALPALFAVSIKTGFCGGGLFQGGFNEADFPGFQLVTDSNHQFFNQAFSINKATTIYCGQPT